MRRGGVTRGVLARMQLYAEAGIPVRLLLTGHGVDENREEAAIRKAWRLPDSVEIRYFWREAPARGAGAAADRLASARDEAGFSALTLRKASSETVRFYRDGLLVKTKHFRTDGTLFRIDHHDFVQRTTSRDYFEPGGRLVRTDNVHPETGVARVRRWYDRAGDCWLTMSLAADGKPTSAVRHLPFAAAYDNVGACFAKWVDEVLASSTTPVVFSDTRHHDHVLLALRHPGARKVAVLHNCHTSPPHRADDPIKPGWEPLLHGITAFDAIVAQTERQQADIDRRFPEGRFTVINQPTPRAVALDVDRQPGLLVAVARLEGQKRLDHAIRAFALAACRVPGARFDIHGTGSEAGALKKLATELGVADLVRFRGFTDHPLRVFASATAAVLSSSFEGSPLVLNEAMSVGTPFVAYDINYGPADVIRHGIDGLLVPAGDVEALADAMERVLGDPEYAAVLGSRAREVTERFSRERWATGWLNLYDALRPQAQPRGETSGRDAGRAARTRTAAVATNS